MKLDRLRAAAVALGFGALRAASVANIALAQPRPPAGGPPAGAQGQPPVVPILPPDGKLPPGMNLPPGVQIRKIDPSELPPSFRQPGALGPPIQGQGPTPRPFPPGARPGPGGLPPGFNPRRPAPPAPPEEESKSEEECPGHGATEPPPPPNWWRGILMVNNDLAQKESPLYQLLFRYENPKDPCDPKNMPPPFLATVLNFAILGFVLYRFGKKPLGEALVKRRNDIMGEIDTAQKLKADAERRLDEYEDKFERIEETLDQMRAEFAAQSELEKAHLLAEAEERRARMRRDAEFRIEQELKTARAELLQEAVLAAAAAAEELLVAKVTGADQDRMADDYLASVSAAVRRGASVGASR
jgi:F-type H+-transporting ATPase subunit b